MKFAHLPSLLLAALFGSGLTLLMVKVTGSPPSPEVTSADDGGQAKPPPVMNPEQAMSLAMEALTEVGISPSSVERGIYPLRGPGRRGDESLPLLSFTCPSDQSCAAVFDAVEKKVSPAGFHAVPPAVEDRAGHPHYRALVAGNQPALALRAFPPGPRLVVVVEGVGQEPELLPKLLALDEQVTFAVLATAPDARASAEALGQAGRELLVQLPLEPATPLPAEVELLSTTQTPEALIQSAAAMMDKVPGAVGLAHHLGGRFTTSPPHMEALLNQAKSQRLFFLDSRTSPGSVGLETARRLGIRAEARTHWLTTAQADLSEQLKAVEAALVLEGRAVLVAPANQPGVLGLGPWLMGLKTRGIHLLRLSEIVL